jgi:hypothetical protein
LQRRLPNDDEVWYFSALLERRLGLFDAAVADFGRARLLNPNGVVFATELGLTLFLLHHFQEAVPVLDATPDGHAVYQRLGFADSWGFHRQIRRERPASVAATPTPAGVTIRPFTSADWPALCAYDAAAFGADFAGVLVTDFYAAYDHYLGPHQRCWAHLLRDIHHLLERHPQDTALQAWATAVHGVYNQACRTTGDSPAQRQRTQRQCEALLLALCEPWLQTDAAVAPQAVLCRRIAKYLPELFSFVADPRVPSTNNAAERSVRPVVVQRKISGGTRSEQGTTTFTTLATLFGTWKARGLDPLVACHSLLLPKTTARSPL